MSESTEVLSAADAVRAAVKHTMKTIVADGWMPPTVGDDMINRVAKAESAVRLVREAAEAWTHCDEIRQICGRDLLMLLDKIQNTDLEATR